MEDLQYKTIHIPTEVKYKSRVGGREKVLKKRIITQQLKWVNNITTDDLQITGQLAFLVDKEGEKGEEENKKKNIMLREIRRKIEGYRHQDNLKNIFDGSNFVDLDNVLLLLRECDEKCFYCKERVKILYDIARDPKQWTLERIFNDRGHNKDNVEIACLSCNIKRRTMYYEKFRFTKQVKFVKEL